MRGFRVTSCLIGIIATGLLVSGCSSQAPKPIEDRYAARQIMQSAHCGLTQPQILQVRSAQELKTLENLPLRQFSLELLKDINFSHETLIIVALGQKPSSGYRTSLKASRVVDGELKLTMTTETPAEGAITAAVITTPCAVLAAVEGQWQRVALEPSQNNR